MIEGLPTLFLTALLVHSVVSASLIPNSNETVLRIAPTFFQSMRTSMSLRQSTLPWRKILKSEDIPVDLIFLIDSSTSVYRRNRNNYRHLRQWIIDVARGFDIANEKVQIGVITYSHWLRNRNLNNQSHIRTVVPLGSCGNMSCFEEGVNRIKFEIHTSFTTFTGAAINKTVKIDFEMSRLDSNKILVLVTDGGSSRDDVFYASAYARTKNITIFSIGVVGNGSHNLRRLQIIANGEIGNNIRVYKRANFNQLREIVADLQREIKAVYKIRACPPLSTSYHGSLKCSNVNNIGSVCSLRCHDNHGFRIQGSPFRHCIREYASEFWNGTTATCGECQGKFDLLVLLDTSSNLANYNLSFIKDFLIRVIDTFHIGPDGVQVSFIHFAEQLVTMWDYDTHQDKHQLQTEIFNLQLSTAANRNSANFSQAISSKLKRRPQYRSGYSRITLVITDGTSSDLFWETAQKLQHLSRVLAIDLSGANTDLIHHLASDPDNKFSISVDGNFVQLLQRIRDVVQKLCLAQSFALKTTCPINELSNPSNCGAALNCTNSNKAGSVCTAQCCGEHELRNSTEVTCLYDGHWSDSMWSCEEKTCSPILKSEQLVINCSDECNINSTCVVSCPSGYVISDLKSNSGCKRSSITGLTECFTTCLISSPNYHPSWDRETNFHCIEFEACMSDPCQNGGTCLEDVDQYSCVCVEGFTGTNCEEINRCEPNPCENSGVCNNNVNGYECQCPAGYEGKNCQDQVNPCKFVKCFNEGSCVNVSGSFECLCAEGYTGTHCEGSISQCVSEPCLNNATCQDTRESYMCECLLGFTGNRCEVNIDECEHKPCENDGECIDLINGYECSCINGYSGLRCEERDNRCSSVTCQNGGECRDGLSSFICDCPPGYGGTYCDEIIDHCLIGSLPKCQNNGSCESITGGFQCICQPGFEGKKCENETLCPLDTNKYSSCFESRGTVGRLCVLNCPEESESQVGNFPANRTCRRDGTWNVASSKWHCAQTSRCKSFAMIDKREVDRIMTGHILSYQITTNLSNENRQMGLDERRLMIDPHIVQSNQSPISANCTNENMVNSVCQFRCAVGWRPMISDTSECGADGRWSHPIKCVRPRCFLPPMRYNVTCSNETEHGSNCTLNCPAGHNIRGPRSKTCTRNSTWKPSAQWSCIPAACSTPPPATANAEYDCTSVHRIGSRCTSRCIFGYKATRTGLYTCATDNMTMQPQWNGVSGICRPASCNKSLNLETGESQGFESDHLVEVYMEPRSRVEQDSQCGFKALLTLHPQELELATMEMWFGENPHGYHFDIRSNASNEDSATKQEAWVSGLDGQLIIGHTLYNTTHTISNTTSTVTNAFPPNGHLTLRIENGSLQFSGNRLSRELNVSVSNFDFYDKHVIKIGLNRLVSNTSLQSDTGVCFLCVSLFE